MRYGNSIKSTHTIIIGETELSTNMVTVRDLNSGEQRQIPLKFDLDSSPDSTVFINNLDCSKLLQYFKNPS